MVERKVVCVVDDDESVRESLPDLLRSAGHDARPFSSAEAFLGSDSVHESDCVVLDVAMPGMTGPELQLELARRRSDLPIVFVTAHAVERVRPLVLGRGAIACLVKPFTEVMILDAIDVALRHGRSRGK